MSELSAAQLVGAVIGAVIAVLVAAILRLANQNKDIDF